MIEQLIKLRQDTPPSLFASTQAWKAVYNQYTQDKTSLHTAIIGGFMCQQLSYAFFSGYQAALKHMFPTVAPGKLKALCVSEEQGSHPKSIQTTLLENKISGVKTYVTAGTDAEHLLVLCKTDTQTNGRPLLKMVHLPPDADQVKVTNFTLPFMQEVKHGKLKLAETPISVEQILPGDGYSQYAKPFRTLEDIFVGASYQGMLLRQALENNWSPDLRDQILLHIHTLKNLLNSGLTEETHLLLAAYERNFENILPEIELNMAKNSSPHFQADWERNKKLLFLGKKVKQLRLTKARNTIFASDA